MNSDLTKSLISEAVGSSLLLAAIVGSGIMGAKLSQGNLAIALLANSLATGSGLIVLILIFGKISGAHFNPLVSFIEYLNGNLSPKAFSMYLCAQLVGAMSGVAIAHLMFEIELYSFSENIRSGSSQLISEFIATFGLISVIKGVGRNHPNQLPFAVGLFIISAFWFSASTSFANPVVTFARAFTNTFTGIRFLDVLPFVLSQTLGAISAYLLFRYLEKPVNNEK